jgi:hypothetical protein
MADRSARALFRAELMERGHDVIGAVSVADALSYPARDPERGPVCLVVVDQLGLSLAGEPSVAQVARRFTNARIVLLASRMLERPSGPWTQVIERPASVGELADWIERARAEQDVRRAQLERGHAQWIERRMGSPWPSIFCRLCGASRHYESPLEGSELEQLRADMDNFLRLHGQIHGHS